MVFTDLDPGDSRSYDSYNHFLYLIIHGEDAATHKEDKSGGDASMIIRPGCQMDMGILQVPVPSPSDKLHSMIRGN